MFSLTEEGQEVYHAVISLFESLNDFSLYVGTLGKELSGEIVILCADQLDTKQLQKLNLVAKAYQFIRVNDDIIGTLYWFYVAKLHSR